MPQTGSFEVRFADGRQSRFFYFDDIPARRLTPEILTSEQALEQAKTFAGGRDARREAAGRPVVQGRNGGAGLYRDRCADASDGVFACRIDGR